MSRAAGLYEGTAGVAPALVGPSRVRFPSNVQVGKGDAFAVCEALALAERALRAAGRGEQAASVAEAFELMEAALIGAARGAG